MPVRTSSLSIKALPLEVVNKEQSEKKLQILSPSSILPTTALFTLQVTTDAAAKLTYKITAQQSNNLMQKSALFYDLSTQYTDYALTSGSSLEELAQEADGLPMLCIELTNISTEIIDNLLQWLYNNNEIKFDDILTSTLASSIKSTFDFFSLLNFATLLDLYEPYCSIIDKILVWYYFGLNEQERNLEILKNDSFVQGIIPARFVKRLAESVSKFEGNQILSSFFRGNIPSEEIFSTKGKVNNEDDYVSDLTENDNNVSTEKSRSNILEWLNSSVITPTPHRVTFSLPNSPSPLDIAEPPTPLGSAYFCISPPPNTPSSPTFRRILPRTPKSTTFTNFMSLSSINEKSSLERDDILEDIPLTAGLSVPPNTPNLLVSNSPANATNSPIVPPNTPISPVNMIVPPNTPNLLVPNSPAYAIVIPNSPTNVIVPPNTPISPANIVVPPNTPNLLVPISPANAIVIPNSPTNATVPPNTPISPANIVAPPNTPNSLVNNIVSPNLPTFSSFSSLLAPSNTPTSPISSSSYSAITINGLLSPTSISFSPSSTPISAPPNTPTSPINNIAIDFSFNNGNNRIPRRNSREKNVTIDSVLANSLNNF